MGYCMWMGPLAAAGYGGNTALGSSLVWQWRFSAHSHAWTLHEPCSSRSHVLFGARERIRRHRPCKMSLAFCASVLEVINVARFHGCFGPCTFESGFHGVTPTFKLGRIAANLVQAQTNWKLWWNFKLEGMAIAFWSATRHHNKQQTRHCNYEDIPFLFRFVCGYAVVNVSTRSTKASGFAWYQRQPQQCCHFVWADWVEQVFFTLQSISAPGDLANPNWLRDFFRVAQVLCCSCYRNHWLRGTCSAWRWNPRFRRPGACAWYL